MKVLFITHYTSLYGANRSLLEMMSWLQKGYNVKPIVLVPGSGDLNDVLSSRGIPCLEVKWYPWSRDENQSHFSPKPLAKRVLNKYLFGKAEQKVAETADSIDLIHTNSSVTQIGGFLSEKFGLPHIWHLREFGEEDYGIVHDGGLDQAGSYFTNHADLLIANSKAVRKKYSNYIPEEMIEVVYNGVSYQEHFVERDFSKLGEESVGFLLVGLLNEAKGQLEAIKAANQLKEKLGIENFELNLAGSGSDSYKAKLKKFVVEKDLQDFVNFLGYKSDIAEVRKSNDVALVCSEQEAFGRVTVEAMLAQMPVIGTNSGGTPEIVDDKETGFLYSSGSPMELANHMKSIIENRDLIREYGEEGHKKAKKQFTAEINAENIFKKYEAVLDGNRGEYQ